MAPIGDSIPQQLLDEVNHLKTRVQELEEKLQHAAGGPKPAAASSVRMILMGPPGAGTLRCLVGNEDSD